MTVYALLPDAKIPFHTSSGNLANGYQLFVYNAGTTVKATTYTDSTGLSSNTNPIVLNSRGETPYGVYVASGTYKLVLATNTDTDPPGSPIWSQDGITPANDVSVADATEWTALAITPTYISAVSFSVSGNQTSVLQVGRRVKTTNTAGTIYSTISDSTFGAATTVTVVNDSGTLDSGLSAVFYGILSATNPSEPTITGLAAGSALDGAADYVPMLDTSASKMVKVNIATFKAITELATNITTTSGTTVNLVASGLSAIPYSEIIITFDGVSLTGTNQITVQLADQISGFLTSGYLSRSAYLVNAAAVSVVTGGSGFFIQTSGASGAIYGSVILTRRKTASLPGGDIWAINGNLFVNSPTAIAFTGGSVPLTSNNPTAKLDGVRLAASGANTFNAGTVSMTGRT